MVAPTAGQQSKLERRGPCSKAVFLTGRLNMQITRPEVGACQHKSALLIILRSEAARETSFAGCAEAVAKRRRGLGSPLYETVGECLKEAHQRIFLLVRKPEPSHELGVHVVGVLRWGPARGTLAGGIGAAAR
jgi:hypothetical protein